ncbi:MAG TPA: acyltransferase family protein [Acidisarcina sp.]|nr:acyltransferase family protein [Acidisarcina sp.]
MENKKSAFRPDIEGLRAVAVLLVIAYHAKVLACKGGFIGVDVFFVLSGYLITGLLIDEVVRSRTIHLVQFYARRIRRLLPASVVMLAATMLAVCFILPPFEQWILSRSALATFAYLSNVYFVHLSNDYFAGDTAGNPLLHTWSLAVEEQFYFAWPILILLAFRLRPSRKVACVVMAVIGVLSFAASVWLSQTNRPLAFFLMPLRAWEFAIGGLASQIPMERIRSRPQLMRVLGWGGLAMVLFSGFVLSPVGFPGTKVLLPVLGSTAILIAGLGGGRASVSSVLGTSPLQYLGQRSYVLYLWHWPLLALVAVLAQPFSLRLRLLCVLVSLILAELTHRLIENPIRFNTYLQRHAQLCIGAAVMIMLIGVGTTSVWRSWAKQSPSYAKYEKVISDIPEDAMTGCLIGYGESAPHECDFGSSHPSKTVVLFGDSHIEQWMPAFQEIANQKKWRVILMVKSSCPALAISVSIQQASVEDRTCRTWRELAIARIQKLHPTAVILSNASNYKEVGRPDVAQSPKEWSAGARQTFTSLRAVEFPLVFLRDTPLPGYDVAQCLLRADWNSVQQCPALLRSTALQDDVYRAQVSGAQGIPNVAFVDLSNQICGDVYCDIMQGQSILYRDSNHMTASFLRGLSTDLYKELVRAAPVLAS